VELQNGGVIIVRAGIEKFLLEGIEIALEGSKALIRFREKVRVILRMEIIQQFSDRG
jgi:hypothetical protein